MNGYPLPLLPPAATAPVGPQLKEDIEGFRKYSQLFMDACNPALQAHHWAQILQGLLGRPADDPAPGDPVSVAHLIEWGAMEQAEVRRPICCFCVLQ